MLMERRVKLMTAAMSVILIAKIASILLLFIEIKKMLIQIWKQQTFAKTVRRNNYFRVPYYLKRPANPLFQQKIFIALILQYQQQ